MSACDATIFAYAELEISSLEFACFSFLKHKIFEGTRVIVGECSSSQGFLFKLFAKPELLRTVSLMGVTRTAIARHLLLLLGSLVFDLERKTGIARATSEIARDSNCLSPWGIFAHLLPASRWCGIIVSAAAVMAEEIAGRFISQERPLGPRRDSLLEMVALLLRHAEVTLRAIDEDTRSRRQGITVLTGSYPGTVALKAIEKINNTMEEWRRRATGIGWYKDHTWSQNLTTSNLDLFQGHPAGTTPCTTSNNPSSKRVEEPQKLISKSDGCHLEYNPLHQHQEDVSFTDALLRDILSTSIDSFIENPQQTLL